VNNQQQADLRKEFLILGSCVLLLGVSALFAVEKLSAVLQLPVLIVALAALILVGRRIVKLDGFFMSRKASWHNQLAEFREQNK
jgi:hypothetical protein